MLNQHYLAHMFPINPPAPGEESSEVPFLDAILEVDSATVARRDDKAEEQLKTLRQNSLPLDASYSQTGISNTKDRIVATSEFERLRLGEGEKLREVDLAGAEGSRITIARARSAEGVEQSRGKRVRDLSRLWRYMGGESPMD